MAAFQADETTIQKGRECLEQRDVRYRTDICCAAAEQILKTRLAGSAGESLVNQSIGDLRGKLN